MSVHSHKENTRLLVALLLLVTLVISTVDADCQIWVYSSSALPVANVNVTFMNGITNVTLNTSTTSSAGYTGYFEDCVNVSLRVRYPSSAYTAVLRNISVSDVHLNNVLSAKVQLINTLGYYLEGQDCSVVVYDANSSDLVYDYDTQCRPDEPYIDSTGNYVATTDCKFTDSLGWYYFQGKTDEALGFRYNHYYNLTFVCNGKLQWEVFKMDLDNPPADDEKVVEWAMRYGGWIVAIGFMLIVVAIVAGVVLFLILRKGN